MKNGGDPLDVGKIPNTLLQKLILDKINIKNKDVVVDAGIGEDCCAIGFGDDLCVMSTDPITGTASEVGRLAVHISCNDIASCGIAPIGMMVTILAPQGTTECELSVVADQLNETADALGVDIIGGHTEITQAVNRFVLISMAVGKVAKGKMVTTSGAKTGDDIIMTKSAGVEGTAILAFEKEDELLPLIGSDGLQLAKSFIQKISVVKEGVLCGSFGVHAMHDVTEGGLLGALWEICEASKKGACIREDAIVVEPITKAICDHFRISPLRLISSGCMLITCQNGASLVKRLRDQSIQASIIGKIIEHTCQMRTSDGKIERISQPASDDLFKII